MSSPSKFIPGAWPEPPHEEANPARAEKDFLEMFVPSTAGDRHPPLRIIVPPSAYCPFSTDLSVPYIGNEKCYPEQSISSLPSTPGLDATPSSSPLSSNPNNMASPTMPVTPEAKDTCDIATINTSVSNTSPAMDAANLSKTNIWVSTGSTWLTDLGGNTETDHIFRNTFFSPISSPTTQNSPVSSLASPASVFPVALLPNMSTSLTSTPLSSPSAPSSVHCASSVFSPIPARLALSATSTAAFPSNIDSFRRWPEDPTTQMNRRKTILQTPSADDTASSAEHIEHTSISLPPRGLKHEALNPRATRSKLFLQKAKKIGARVRRFVLQDKRNKWPSTMQADVSFEVNTRPESDDGSIVVISAYPPHDNCPSPHSSEQRRRSLSVLSHHPFWVGGCGSRSVEGAVAASPMMLPADARGLQEFSVPKRPNRRFTLAAFSSFASLKRR